jgi:uncharacterized protein (DUF885 family)
MRLYQSLFFLIALAGSLCAQDLQPVADRLAALNALFDEQYESDFRNIPQDATAFGDYRYNDKLADESLAAIAQREETNRTFLSRLQAIATTGFSDQDQLSHDLLVTCPPAAHRRLRTERIRDADQPNVRHPHRSCRSASVRSP